MPRRSQTTTLWLTLGNGQAHGIWYFLKNGGQANSVIIEHALS